MDFLEELPANLVTRILKTTSGERRAAINTLLHYPSDSAGSVMTTEYVALHREDTVDQALEVIRRTGIHKETIYTCYVLENRRLLGIVTVKDLLTAPGRTPVEELMETQVVSVNTHTDQETAARLLAKYDLLALPVTDLEGRMVGILTIDDAVDAMLAKGIPAGPINTIDRVTKDPHIAGAREMFVDVDHPKAGHMKVTGNQIKLTNHKIDTFTPAPLLGQHTKEVLMEKLGMTEEEAESVIHSDAVNGAGK